MQSAIAGAIVFAVAAWDAPVAADPLRLRGEALSQTQSPVGLVVLHGEDRVKPWLDAEAVVWAGATDVPGLNGDVQTLTVRLRDPSGLGEARIGRFVFSAGAIRPIQIDGVRALGRAPTGTTLEVFGGAPVAYAPQPTTAIAGPQLASRLVDLATGARLAQTFGTFLTVGGAYVVQQKDGRTVNQEAGPDFAFMPAPWLDAAGRMAFDLLNSGIVDALGSVAARSKSVRVEAFVTRRSPGKLLPATSLFSVLGDLPSTTSGGTLRWKAAPRLDLMATGAAVDTGSDVGGMGTFRATLALDDDAKGSAGLELRRQYVGTSRWSGARMTLIVPLSTVLRASGELEIVRPDPSTRPGTSKVWPWGLAAITYRFTERWDAAAAVEGLRTRDDRNEIHALLRLSYSFERSR